MKVCSGCALSQPLSQFYKHPDNPDGLRGRCKTCLSKQAKAYRAANRDRYAVTSAAWRRANKYLFEEMIKAWRLVNPGKSAAATAKYKAAKKKRTPRWLTPTQLDEITQFYVEAQELRWLSNEPLEVDHIVPLQGKNVSGLHVPWNLQILPKAQNGRKGNRYEGR